MTIAPLPTDSDRTGPVGAAPALRPPTPEQIVTWAVRVVGEVARAPFTFYRLRKMIDAMARLPEQIEALTIALDRTTDTLESTLGRMDGRLEAVQDTFGAVDGRVEHLDASVTDLSVTLTNLIGSIPGARRSLRATSR